MDNWNFKRELEALVLAYGVALLAYGAFLITLFAEHYLLAGYWSIVTVSFVALAFERKRALQARYPMPWGVLWRS